jgi:hypothetical protein
MKYFKNAARFLWKVLHESITFAAALPSPESIWDLFFFKVKLGIFFSILKKKF